MSEILVPSFTNSPNTTKSPIVALRDILVHEMELDEERVNIYNQKWKIPTDDEIFLVLSQLASKVYRSKSEFQSADNTEHSYINVQELLDISILSRNESAFFRKEEIPMALESIYSQQIQDLYSFKISRIPTTFIDVSEVEASARIYRFSLNVVALTWYHKSKAADYYNSFNGKVYAESISTDKLFTQNTV